MSIFRMNCFPSIQHCWLPILLPILLPIWYNIPTLLIRLMFNLKHNVYKLYYCIIAFNHIILRNTLHIIFTNSTSTPVLLTMFLCICGTGYRTTTLSQTGCRCSCCNVQLSIKTLKRGETWQWKVKLIAW